MKEVLKKLKIEELKKEKKFLGKVCLFFLIAILLYSCFHGYNYYLDFKGSNDQIAKIKKGIAKKQVEKFDNIETKIFDLSEEEDEIEVSDLEDISDYQGEDQDNTDINIDIDRISTLEKEVADLKLRIEQISDSGRKTALVISYVHLRQKVFSYFDNDFSYYEELKNFEILSMEDEFFKNRIGYLKSIIRRKISHESLVKRFDDLADRFASSKEFEEDSELLSKIKTNLLKIIVIRKVGEKNKSTIDGKVVLINRYLKNQDYMRANRLLLSMDNRYRILAGAFLMDLNHMIALQRLDGEILNYLSNNN